MFQSRPKQVNIREVGPRDGLQNEAVFVPTEVKKEFIRRLIDAGLRAIEITSFVNPKWIPALADGAEIGSEFGDLEGVRTTALVPNMKGLENALKAGMRRAGRWQRRPRTRAFSFSADWRRSRTASSAP